MVLPGTTAHRPPHPTRFPTVSSLCARCRRGPAVRWKRADAARPARRRLVALAARARAGSPVGKDALIDAAWPGLAVEDSNLTVQIAALRRVLEQGEGVGWIETLPRRGYRYVGPPVVAALPIPEKPSIAVLPFSNLGGSAEQEYFVDGMVDDIITGLSPINSLF